MTTRRSFFAAAPAVIVAHSRFGQRNALPAPARTNWALGAFDSVRAGRVHLLLFRRSQ